jgi:hypothetical protein
MINERSTVIKIGDREYELLLTTKATKKIWLFKKLGDKLLKMKILIMLQQKLYG